ncbi:respiratory nitrate reductase 1 subunit alpha [Salmonella enterica subsp. enterica]|uniref:Respiratory nitrate reductase 1 subunit alpha n=1 Tax=Salmonella enterica I TaxID=59201 RepID=A0A379WSS6_SALET|nr:respiratory nitrate reductase 1 subunit alpha [Salmonella enterica subsp. enterica]
MLTLSRGGPIVWMSETDAKDLGIEDNDWIEVFNSNGALTARASGQPACTDGHDHDVPRAGTYRKPAGVGNYPAARRYS